MMYSQYLRVESKAGGVYCSDREFIRAARTLLTKEGKSRNQRDTRHFWIREGLKLLQEARDMVLEHRL